MKKKDLETKMGMALKEMLKKIRQVGFAGRCWGLRKENAFWGSHVDLGRGDEFATVFVKDGEVVVAEYVRSRGTKLGREIKKVLLENDILVN